MPTTRTYSPLPPMIPAGDIFCANPRVLQEPDSCPHTYGVRVCSCAAFATEPCRPTACTTHATNLSSSLTDNCSLVTYHCSLSNLVSTIFHSPFFILNWSHTFSAKERDTETGLSYFGSRYYSSDLSIWLSVDPMSDKYPSLSPYVYCADNPVRLIDPDGRWIPGLDEDNNIVVTQEDGDDLNSFRKFMGPAYSDDEIQKMYGDLQEGKINLTTSYGSVFQLMTDAINDAKKDPFFTQNKNYNCWGASLALMREEKLYGDGLDSFFPWDSHGVGLNSPGLFDLALNNYTPVKQETASVGKTIMRFGAPCWGKTTHASIFLGVDNSGNEYTFSKDGWNLRPVVCKSHGLVYKNVVGRTPFESGYYSK